MLFYDRHDAGRQLAQKLVHYVHEKPFVIGLPRGGVVVAYEVSRALKAPLDVIIARKLGAPTQPELGIGAIAPNGVRILNQRIIDMLGISSGQIEEVTGREAREMERRLKLYRGDRPAPDIRNRTVILVDDGLATGVSAKAAIRALKQNLPKKIILAIPVSSPDTIEAIRPEVDDLVCIATPLDFMSVGNWYQRFEQTSDEEVIHLLQSAQKNPVFEGASIRQRFVQ